MKLKFVYKGGEGSGFYGHAGRPGEVGGSRSFGNKKDEFASIDEAINAPEIFRKLNIPKVLYHITDKKFADSIREQGILAKSRQAKETIDRGAYLTPSSDIKDILRQEDINIEHPVIIEVSTKGLDLRLDPEFWDGAEPSDYIEEINNDETEWAMYSQQDIPATNILSIKYA